MTTPPLCGGDLLLVSNGPGTFMTVEAMAKLAQDKGADVRRRPHDLSNVSLLCPLPVDAELLLSCDPAMHCHCKA